MIDFYNFEFSGVWLLNAFVVILLSLHVSKMLFNNVTSRLKYRKKLPPGPVGLPFIGYLPFLGKKPHVKLRDMNKDYGDMIGMYFGPMYTVVLNEYSVAKDVLCHAHALDRAPGTFDYVPGGFIGSNGAEWLEQRRFCFNAIRDIGLGTRQWEECIYDEVADFTEMLHTYGGKPTDISAVLNTSISSGILSLLIGRKLTEEHDSDKKKLAVDFIDASVRYVDPASAACMVPGLRKVLEVLHVAGYHESSCTVKKFISFIREEILRHKTLSDLRGIKDFINVYLTKTTEMCDLKNRIHYFSEEMLLGNLNVLYLASSDTLFASVTWFLRLMAKHQDVQILMHSEIQQALKKTARIAYADREETPYTFAVLMEVERFATVVPLPGPRMSTDDIVMKGYVIPKGTNLLMNSWALHNDPKYWQNPEKFLPQRFLTSEGKLIKNPPSFSVFSYGKRNCPGEVIAWMEFLCYASEIIRQFEIKTYPGEDPIFEEINGLVTQLKPQKLCFVPRI